MSSPPSVVPGVSAAIMMCSSLLATPRAGKKDSASLVLSPSKTTPGGERWFLKGNWGDVGEGDGIHKCPTQGSLHGVADIRRKTSNIIEPNQMQAVGWVFYIHGLVHPHKSLSRRVLLSPSSRQGDGTSHTSSNLPRSSWKVVELVFKFKSVEFQGPYFVPCYQAAKTEPPRNGIAFCFDEIKLVKKCSLRERDKGWRRSPDVLPPGNVPASCLTSLVRKEGGHHRQKGQHKHTKKEFPETGASQGLRPCAREVVHFCHLATDGLFGPSSGSPTLGKPVDGHTMGTSRMWRLPS